MRRIDFREQFDAAGNLWTSFGFFEDDSQNLVALTKCYRALKPGGRFMLHVTNRDWIMANYQTHTWFASGEVTVVQTNRFDYAASVTHSTWTFIRSGSIRSHKMMLLMYSYHELRAMLSRVGFSEIEGFGSADGKPISREYEMVFLVAWKPALT